jgi:hypothetical protein
MDLNFGHGFIPRIGSQNYKAGDRCLGPDSLFDAPLTFRGRSSRRPGRSTTISPLSLWTSGQTQRQALAASGAEVGGEGEVERELGIDQPRSVEHGRCLDFNRAPPGSRTPHQRIKRPILTDLSGYCSTSSPVWPRPWRRTPRRTRQDRFRPTHCSSSCKPTTNGNARWPRPAE